MKKILYTLLAISIIFSACEKEEDNNSSDNNNNNNSTSFSIGDSHQGGIIFYIDASGQHGLIAATSDQGQTSYWGCYGTTMGTSTAIGDGQSNTTAILNGCSSFTSPVDGFPPEAALLCSNYSVSDNGILYDDWFLPSKDELNLMWENIGKGSPLGNVGNFADFSYFSSSEYDIPNPLGSGFVHVQDFNAGSQHDISKTFVFVTTYVRAIRSF